MRIDEFLALCAQEQAANTAKRAPPINMSGSELEKLLRASPVVDGIAKCLSVTDLIALSWSSKKLREAFYPVYQQRVDLRLKLSRNFKDPDALIKCMRDQKVVIGGNRSISFIWDDVIPQNCKKWEFYVLLEVDDIFRDHLKNKQGLTELPDVHHDTVRDTAFEWLQLEGDNVDVTVNILTSRNPYPITQIIGKYYLTILNCFSSADTTFIAYPEFTLNKLIAEREESNKVEYALNRDRYNKHNTGIIEGYLALGFTKVDKVQLRKAMVGRPNSSYRFGGLCAPTKNPSASPIKIMHKRQDRKRPKQLTEVELGVVARIRAQKYRYVDFLPPVWIPQSWTKMRPTHRIDPTDVASKAKGQGMGVWMERAEQWRLRQVAIDAEYDPDSDSQEDDIGDENSENGVSK
ncbi:hypothetical protein H072_6172 [Dactylellina haptotyla CBS 200.50]|uniref:Uncharacterized protein n=1 Tax=Dactylellina haptotyla (strain CBS 200.50) TaxID=1284197 RepID=S8AAR9_DACHA|nr:hypothetical protein H072_6172 [Dactylellina haptotyla CBS 200.50]